MLAVVHHGRDLAFWLQLIVAGFSTGCIYSLAGMGLVLTYKATGVFNFSHGAVAMIVAYALWQADRQWHWPLWISALLALFVVGPAVGLFLERVVFRPLERRGATQAEKLVATIGTTLLLIGAAFAIWTGTVRDNAPRIVPSGSFDLPIGLRIGTDQLAIVLIVALVSVGLWMLFRFTRTGLEIRAVVDRRELSELASINANRVSGLSWALGCGLAGLTGVLLAPQANLDPFHFTLLVFETFSIAVVARLVSLPIAAGAGILFLGVLSSLLTQFHGRVLPLFHAHFPSRLSDAFEQLKGPNLSVLILFVALLLLRTLDEAGEGSGRPGLVSRAIGHRPRVTRPQVVAGTVMGLVAIVAPFFLSRIRIDNAQRMLALTVVFISIVCITGFCGYITLGQAAFAGTGAYVSARVANAFGLPVILAMLIGGLGAVVVGLIAGYPALKRRGLFLGLTTLAIGLLTYQFVFSSNIFAGGSSGLTTHRPSLFGLSLDGERPFYWFELAWVGVLLLLARNLRSGRLGRILAAMRDSETATRSIGIDLRRYKLFIFSVSAFIAGIGGALLAQQTRVFSPFAFDPLTSLRWFLVVVVAGVGSLSGALVAGVGFIVVSLTVHTAGVSDLLFAVLALFIGWLPGGSLVGLARNVGARLITPAEPGPAAGPPARVRAGAIVGGLAPDGAGGGDLEGVSLVASPFARRVLQDAGRDAS